MKNLKWDVVYISPHKTNVFPLSFNCSKTTDSKSMIFEGDGYAKFSLYLIDPSYIDNIHLVFQTLQKEGVLLFINDKLKVCIFQVIVSYFKLTVKTIETIKLTKGAVVVVILW